MAYVAFRGACLAQAWMKQEHHAMATLRITYYLLCLLRPTLRAELGARLDLGAALGLASSLSRAMASSGGLAASFNLFYCHLPFMARATWRLCRRLFQSPSVAGCRRGMLPQTCQMGPARHDAAATCASWHDLKPCTLSADLALQGRHDLPQGRRMQPAIAGQADAREDVPGFPTQAGDLAAGLADEHCPRRHIPR